MILSVIGISHKTAPVELREKLAFSPERLKETLKEIKENYPALEIVILSTCNRTEIYTASEENMEEWCTQFLANTFGQDSLKKYLYTKFEREMNAHLFAVAAGLDSLVIGETEILKQVKDAYALSYELSLTGKILNVLFQRAIYVGKLVRTQTGVSRGTVSVGSVAVNLSEKIFGDLRNSTVLLFGAGKMAELSARYLASKKIKKLLVANRTLENAKSLAEKFQAQALSFEEGLNFLSLADVVLTSVSGDKPFLKKELVAETMRKRQNRSLFIVDIGVPRNVEETVHRLDNVYLYNIDDLETIVQENIAARRKEVEKARALVQEKSKEFYSWYCSLKSGEEKSLKHSLPSPAPFLSPSRKQGED